MIYKIVSYYNENIKNDNILLFTIFCITFVDNLVGISLFNYSAFMHQVVAFLSRLLFLSLIVEVIYILRDTYSRNVLSVVMDLGVLILLLIVTINSESTIWLKSFILMLACRNSRFKSICFAILCGYLCILLLSVFLYNFDLSSGGVVRRGYLNYGFVHPNLAALILLIISFLFIVCFEGRWNNYNLFFVFIINIFSYTLFDSRTALISFLIFCSYTLLFDNNKMIQIQTVLTIVYPIILIILILFLSSFVLNHKMMLLLNTLLSDRVVYWSELFKSNTLSFFGQTIDFDYCFYSVINNNSYSYLILDNTYLYILFVYGVVPFLLFIILNVILIKVNLKKHNTYILGSIIAIMTYGMFETNTVNILVNFPMFYLFTQDD